MQLAYSLGLESGKASRACEAAAPLDRVSHLLIPGNLKPSAHCKPKEVGSMATSVSSNALEAKMSSRPGKLGLAIFALVLIIGGGYAVSHLMADLGSAPHTSSTALLLLGVALFTALGFEFVNGFHDTAN